MVRLGVPPYPPMLSVLSFEYLPALDPATLVDARMRLEYVVSVWEVDFILPAYRTIANEQMVSCGRPIGDINDRKKETRMRRTIVYGIVSRKCLTWGG